MSSKKLITYTATAFMAVVVGFMACKKDDNTGNVNTNTTEDLSFVIDNARLEQQFDEVQSFADQAAALGSVALKGDNEAVLGGSCAIITRDTALRTITIDFGKEDCLCKDGRHRRGAINIAYTGKYQDSGSTHSIAFVDYVVDQYQVTGTKTVTNMGHNQYHQIYFNINIDGSIILPEHKGTIGYKATRERTWVTGAGTPIFSDDVFNVRGSGTYTRADGKTYAVTIKSPLLVALSCSWIKQGVIEFAYDNLTRVLDYDTKTQACDDQAILNTGNGNLQNITLP